MSEQPAIQPDEVIPPPGDSTPAPAGEHPDYPKPPRKNMFVGREMYWGAGALALGLMFGYLWMKMSKPCPCLREHTTGEPPLLQVAQASAEMERVQQPAEGFPAVPPPEHHD
jgi:hypothetical protein